MSELVVVELPSGGRAWCRTKLGHGRAKIVRRAFRRTIPSGALDAILAARAAQSSDGTAPSQIRLDTPDLIAAADALEDYEAVLIREVVVRWQDVFAADDPTRALAFPDDIEELDEADFEALFTGASAAYEGGRANPPNGRPTSSGSSAPESPSPTTPLTT